MPELATATYAEGTSRLAKRALVLSITASSTTSKMPGASRVVRTTGVLVGRLTLAAKLLIGKTPTARERIAP